MTSGTRLSSGNASGKATAKGPQQTLGSSDLRGAQSEAVARLSEEQALNWFVALNRATVTDSERMAFNRWLALDPRNRRSYKAVLQLWQRLDLNGTSVTPGAHH